MFNYQIRNRILSYRGNGIVYIKVFGTGFTEDSIMHTRSFSAWQNCDETGQAEPWESVLDIIFIL
jgi:hypothetical protein